VSSFALFQTSPRHLAHFDSLIVEGIECAPL
jgi:hypothetical protein